jgi:hypothetical protein
MDMPTIEVVETHRLEPGNFFILHRARLDAGVAAVAGIMEGSTDLRLIPFASPSESIRAFTAMYESALGGTALKLPNARLEVDFGSASDSATAYGTSANDAIIAVDKRLVLPLRHGYAVTGYLDLGTGIISRVELGDSWMAFDRWRVVDGSDQAVQLFASSGWKEDDER